MSQLMMSQAVSRYAVTLFELCDSKKKLDSAQKDAQAYLNLFETSDELLKALKSPLHKAEEKAGVLAAIGAKLKTSVDVNNFIAIVAKNSRAGELPAMFKAFLGLVAKSQGVIKAEVSTASELSAAQLEELTKSLSQAFNADVSIETDVKPELIGGLVVKVGSRLFDDSIKTKLEALKNNLKGA